MPKFVSLEGIDGAGKTSLIKRLNELPDVGVVQKKMLSSDDHFVECQIEKIKNAMYPGFDGKFDHTMGSEYWIYLQCVWYDLIYKNLILTAEKSLKFIVSDGWYFKFIAKVEQEGFSLEKLSEVFSLIPKPDLVVFLDVAPETACKRGKEFSYYEAGSHQGLQKSRESFLAFQSNIRNNLCRQQDGTWVRVPVNGLETLDVTFDKVSKILFGEILG